MAVLEVVSLPFCTVVLAGGAAPAPPGEPPAAKPPPGRLFAAYRVRGAYRWFLGQGVIDEFATLASPVFVAPAPLLGQIYDAGLTLAFRRDPELPLDAGWPPICLGTDARTGAPPLPEGWQEDLLRAVGDASVQEEERGLARARAPALGAVRVASVEAKGAAAGHRLERVTIGEVAIVGTDAPLLPAQLGRLCEAGEAAFTLGIATGNRIAGGADGDPQPVAALSEAALAALATAAREATA